MTRRHGGGESSTSMSQAFSQQWSRGDNTLVGRQKHEIREAVMADLDTDWILSDTVFT